MRMGVLSFCGSCNVYRLKKIVLIFGDHDFVLLSCVLLCLGMFYVVVILIGNFEDIMLRVLRILGEVDLILCEDTWYMGRLM